MKKRLNKKKKVFGINDGLLDIKETLKRNGVWIFKENIGFWEPVILLCPQSTGAEDKIGTMLRPCNVIRCKKFQKAVVEKLLGSEPLASNAISRKMKRWEEIAKEDNYKN